LLFREFHLLREEEDWDSDSESDQIILAQFSNQSELLQSASSGQFQGSVKRFHGSSTGLWADTTIPVQTGKKNKLQQELIRKQKQNLIK